jgi:hypothetical protein
MSDEAIVNRLLRDVPSTASYISAADIRAEDGDRISVWADGTCLGVWPVEIFKELLRRKAAL